MIEVKIEGFDELAALFKKLPDKVKRNELNKIYGQVANPTVKAMRSFAPVFSGKKPARRQVGKTIIAKEYIPGYGRKTIRKKVLRKTPNSLISIGPHSSRTAKNKFAKEGYYLRQWVIPGTRYFKGNDFVQRAFDQTKGTVTKEAENKTAAYIQKQINRLSK